VHPILARPQRLLLYLMSWGVLGVIIAGGLCLATPRPFAHALIFVEPLMVLFGGACLSAYWMCRAHPLELETAADATSTLVSATMQSSAVLTATAASWAFVLSRVAHIGPDRAGMVRDLVALLALGVLFYLLAVVVSYLYLAIEASHEAAERTLSAQVGAREAELRALRAQLDPHFLFNSLNSINALIGRDPAGARRMCERLGEFMRRTLKLGARETVTLGEELELVEDYLAIEQVRFGERLRVERDIEPAALAGLLPPLLLQPLVENAVKHGVAGRIEGGTLRLSAVHRDGALVVAIENPVDADAPLRPGTGTGLENVRRRLEALGAGRIVLERDDGWFRATLALAWDPAHVEAAHG
jgi:two-component system, LytTR family, sensor histidine kinase AlgZ